MLTRTGWPRPIIGGLPIPWVSPSNDLSTMHASRATASASGAVCAVCGEGYGEDEEAYALVREAERPATLDGIKVHAMDNAVMHRRCVRLAMKVCPKLRSLQEEGLLQVVRTKGNVAGQEFIEAEGRFQAVIDGADCEPLSLDSLARAQGR